METYLGKALGWSGGGLEPWGLPWERWKWVWGREQEEVLALPCEEEGCGVTKFVAVKDGTRRGAGTSVLPGSLGHEAERSIGSDSSRPLGAYNGGFAGTWRV